MALPELSNGCCEFSSSVGFKREDFAIDRRFSRQPHCREYVKTSKIF
jgi:hypothetical protein